MAQSGISANSSKVKNIFPGRKVLSNSSLEILNWMMHAKYTRKEFDQCKELAEKELERSNNYNEYANFILGNIYKEKGEIQKSLKYFHKCNQLNPQNVEYLKQIGRCQFLLGRYKSALETFCKADKLSRNPDWNIYHHLGVCYSKTKAEDKAKEYLKNAVALGRCEKSFAELAKLYDNQKDYANAIEVYQSALRLYSSSTELSVSLGLIFMKIEDYRKAFNHLGSALAHDPVNANALFTFAAEIQRHGEFDVALIKYKLAVHKLPECAEMWNNIGMCFFGKRKYVSAITCLKRSYYLNPMNWLTSYNLGLLHLNMKQYASAALFLSTAAKLNPQHGPTFTLLALALKQLADDSNCRKCFEEALKLNANDIEACINFSHFLFSIGEKTESLKYYSHYQQLLDMMPHIDKELIQMGSSLSEALQVSRDSNSIVKNIDKSDNIVSAAEGKQSSAAENNADANSEKRVVDLPYGHDPSTAAIAMNNTSLTNNETEAVDGDLV